MFTTWAVSDNTAVVFHQFINVNPNFLMSLFAYKTAIRKSLAGEGNNKNKTLTGFE